MRNARAAIGGWGLACLLGLGLGLTTADVRAAAPVDEVRYSTDATSVLGATTLADEEVAADDLGGNVSPVLAGLLPPGADLDAYELLANGDELFSLDTTADLAGGLHVGPGDVVRYDGTTLTLEFDAVAGGLPPGVNVDAVGVVGGDLLLSFDVTVDLGGQIFDDADLARLGGTGFSLHFDAQAAGVDAALDLDAVYYSECYGFLLVSFDGAGAIGAIPFDDEDVLEYDPAGGTWDLSYDASSFHPGWSTADLDALHVDLVPPTSMVFGQTVLANANQVDFEWPVATPYEAARGSFTMLGEVGNYAADATFSGTGTSLTDSAVPAAGTAFWYLVSTDMSCVFGSWQTTPGAEPQRDAALP